jgi:DNA-binding NarL/FixJ family response regulator
MAIRVLLVDDHPVVRAGYSRLLEGGSAEVRGGCADIRVVAEADSAAGGYAAFLTHAPEVTVTDLSLPGSSGIDLIRRIRAREAAARVLVFSVYDESVMVGLALRAGATGFVSKRCAPEVLREAVHAVYRGACYLSEDVRAARAAGSPEAARAALEELSPREFEVFRLLARGHSAAESAALLNLSVKTVANYQTLIKEKLGLSTSAALVHLALRLGVVEAPTRLRE